MQTVERRRDRAGSRGVTVPDPLAGSVDLRTSSHPTTMAPKLRNSPSATPWSVVHALTRSPTFTLGAGSDGALVSPPKATRCPTQLSFVTAASVPPLSIRRRPAPIDGRLPTPAPRSVCSSTAKGFGPFRNFNALRSRSNQTHRASRRRTSRASRYWRGAGTQHWVRAPPPASDTGPLPPTARPDEGAPSARPSRSRVIVAEEPPPRGRTDRDVPSLPSRRRGSPRPKPASVGPPDSSPLTPKPLDRQRRALHAGTVRSRCEGGRRTSRRGGTDHLCR